MRRPYQSSELKKNETVVENKGRRDDRAKKNKVGCYKNDINKQMK